MKPVIFFKPKYIRKYDYLRSFYQPQEHWFADLKSFSEYVHDKLIEVLEAKKDQKLISDESDDEEAKKVDFDVHDYTKSLDLTKNEIKQKGLDQNDPKVKEGLEIDLQSKAFIISQFPNCSIVDFDEIPKTNEQKQHETINILKQQENCILFQPVFIFNGVIDKPDAIIKQGNEITLIEVKGTTNPKLYHLFDLFFQTTIINEVLDELDMTITKHQLCLVKYELKNFQELSFVLVDKIALNKTGFSKPTSLNKYVDKFDQFYIESIARSKQGIEISEKRTITNILDEMHNEEPDLEPRNAKEKKQIKNIQSELNHEMFWKRIDLLKKHEVKEADYVSLAPSKAYKSMIKDNDALLALKDYYYFSLAFLPFNFSGNLIDYANAIDIFNGPNHPTTIDKLFDDFKNYSEKLSNRGLKYFNTLTSNSPQTCCYNNIVAFNKEGVEQLLAKIKQKKVYFDFESLNLATRTMNGIPPFMQTVNQVSVVIEDDTIKAKDPNYKPITKPYVVIDPINGISKQDLKLIIDTILPCNDLEEAKQYSYIVYNINFEKTCLKAMKAYLKDEEYGQKIDVIINNLFDLADFFNIKNDKSNFFIFKELFGYYSIKKVLPLVQKYDLESYLDSECKDYKLQLEQVHNGVDAQKYSTLRFFGLINDEEWAKVSHNLGIYCNNDVLAMVAIEHFVRKIIKDQIAFDQ